VVAARSAKVAIIPFGVKSISSLPPINLRVNTVDAVADQLRNDLIRGSIVPGDRLLPKQLAKRFSVSHIPVREALRRLEAEGLVVAYPHGATYASEVGIVDLDGIYDLRFIVEGEFSKRSAGARTDEHVETARACWQALLDVEPYSEAFFAAHRDYQWALLAPGASEVAHRVLERLWRSTDRYLSLAVTRLEDFSKQFDADETRQEHVGLLEAFASGDGDLLRSRLVAHLGNTRDQLRVTFSAAISSNRLPWLKEDSLPDHSASS